MMRLLHLRLAMTYKSSSVMARALARSNLCSGIGISMYEQPP
ncbi:MAG: hypothetical protein AABZ11_10210 [Nitrospinota bacterium]